MKRRESPPPSYDRDISALFSLLSLILFATLAIAILFHGEPFLFWQHAFSDLGNIKTLGGQPNATSRLTFSVGMIVQSAIMLRISACYAGNETLWHHTVKRWLALLGAIGFVVSIYPNDINHLVHSVGVGIVIGVVYLFTMIFHCELKPVTSPWLFYGDLVIIQVSVFSYAIAFFADWELKQSLQKTCVMGVFFTLQRIITAAEESFHLSEVITFLQRFGH
ncbi:MAG: hypothetical protein PVG25_10430 [Anaerolineae bacterium]|jgi:hypothetical protein